MRLYGRWSSHCSIAASLQLACVLYEGLAVAQVTSVAQRIARM